MLAIRSAQQVDTTFQLPSLTRKEYGVARKKSAIENARPEAGNDVLSAEVNGQ